MYISSVKLCNFIWPRRGQRKKELLVFLMVVATWCKNFYQVFDEFLLFPLIKIMSFHQTCAKLLKLVMLLCMPVWICNIQIWIYLQINNKLNTVSKEPSWRTDWTISRTAVAASFSAFLMLSDVAVRRIELIRHSTVKERAFVGPQVVLQWKVGFSRFFCKQILCKSLTLSLFVDSYLIFNRLAAAACRASFFETPSPIALLPNALHLIMNSWLSVFISSYLGFCGFGF